MSFVRGSQYACTSTICYGIGDAAHKALMQLQSIVNSALKATGSKTSIPVDGKIGQGTVTALRTLADRIKTPTLSILKSAPMDSKEFISKFAPELSVEIPTALATTASGIDTGQAPRVTTTSPSVNAALDNFASIIRKATATAHGAVPPATPTTPPIISTAGPTASMNTAPMAPYTPPSSMTLGTKLALGGFGLAAVGAGSYLLFGFKKSAAPATISGARRRKYRR